MTETMVERVADALDDLHQQMVDVSMGEKHALLFARAAIEAMREPSTEMLKAFLPRSRVGDVSISYGDALTQAFLKSIERDWAAAIDVVLSEEAGGDGAT